MGELYKSVTFIAISFAISFLSLKIESSFLDVFASNFIALLTTLLAINIASGSLIAGKLKEINIQTGESFEKTRGELKRSLKIQVILIAISFFTLMFKESKSIANAIEEGTLNLIANTITTAIFIYYLDTIKDIGYALFSLLEFKTKKE